MADVKERRLLPKELSPDRFGHMSLCCRFGWHQWHYPNVFGAYACDRYQLKTCLRCNRQRWVKVGVEARG